jgi:ketosteroid isomerase-like protein
MDGPRYGISELAGRTSSYRGHAGVRAYFADAQRLWSDLTIEADDFRAVADSVIVFGHVHGRVGG